MISEADMALNGEVKVPVPEHGAVKRRMGDKIYLYYATAVYRNEKGQPTCDRVSIGRYDEATGMLIPNRNYYEIYLKQPQPMQGAIRDHGVYYAFSEIIKKYGIEKDLKKYFPEQYKQILTVAQYMISEGNVIYYIDEYTETHRTALNGVLSDAECSRLFSGMREEDMLLFLREWMKRMKQNEYIAYDVTSISTYGKNIPDAEWGYNRDKEKLPQINLGMYYGEESRLPLYYRVYPGSINDKTHLAYMTEDNKFINGEKIRYVMDRGFYSAENLRLLVEEGHRFVIALPGSLKYCHELIGKHRAELVNVSKNRIGNKHLYGMKAECTELGFRMNVHIFYDPEKAFHESEALYELLDRQENDLAHMEEPPDRKLHYDKYFFINRSKDGKLGYTRNNQAIDEELGRCGFFLIAETDFKKTTAEILDIYRRRDMVEKNFDNLKNGLDFKRVRTHNPEVLHGKIFVSFLALIVRSYMVNRLSDVDLPMKKVLLELDKLKTIDIGTAVKPRLINPPTKTIRDILDKLDIPCDFVCDNSVGI